MAPPDYSCLPHVRRSDIYCPPETVSKYRPWAVVMPSRRQPVRQGKADEYAGFSPIMTWSASRLIKCVSLYAVTLTNLWSSPYWTFTNFRNPYSFVLPDSCKFHSLVKCKPGYIYIYTTDLQSSCLYLILNAISYQLSWGKSQKQQIRMAS